MYKHAGFGGVRQLSGYNDDGLEYSVVSRVTKGLAAAEANGAATSDGLMEAVELNRRLWFRFAVLVSDDENALPDATRASIVSLASYVERVSAQISADNRSGLSSLIDINKSIMRGLRMQMQSRPEAQSA